MAKKLEKRCEPNNLILGERYSISPTNLINEFVFVVTDIDDTFATFTYLDGSKGLMPVDYGFAVYEFPFSSLEKELL
jgi:hypothetical protein